MSTDEFREMFCTIFQVEKYFTPQIFEWMARYIQYVKATYVGFMELTIRKTATLKSTVAQTILGGLYKCRPYWNMCEQHKHKKNMKANLLTFFSSTLLEIPHPVQ